MGNLKSKILEGHFSTWCGSSQGLHKHFQIFWTLIHHAYLILFCWLTAQTCQSLSGLTAAERLIARTWKNPYSFTKQKWLLDFLNIANMVQWVAQTHRAKEENIRIEGNHFYCYLILPLLLLLLFTLVSSFRATECTESPKSPEMWLQC